MTDDVFPVEIAIEWSYALKKSAFLYLMQVSSQQRYQTGRRKSIHWPRESQITVSLRKL